MRLALSLVLVAACAGKPAVQAPPPPPPDPIPATAGPDCKTVGAHLATLVERDPAASDEEASTAGRFRKRCEADTWSDEVRSCLATASNDSEQEGCLGKLPADQRASFAKVHPTAKAGDAEVAPAAAAAPAPDAKGHTTRGAVKKDKPKGNGRTSDPCEGGE
jgi:hypothetical protein